jgi:hypothetical protein
LHESWRQHSHEIRGGCTHGCGKYKLLKRTSGSASGKLYIGVKTVQINPADLCIFFERRQKAFAGFLLDDRKKIQLFYKLHCRLNCRLNSTIPSQNLEETKERNKQIQNPKGK